ncbi:MAG: type II secretion system protein [bacterium]|nr:type II secretion system protein [bacterium]
MKLKILKFKNEKLKFREAVGFTLIEVMVSLFVIGTSMTAILFIFSTSINSATTVKNNTVAAALAQEGAEIMNNLRNEDWINSRAFGSFGNPGGVLADGQYRVQWNSSQTLTLSSNPFLRLDSNTGIYSYDMGNDTLFKRAIAIETVVPDIQKRITITMTWADNRGNTKTLTAESHLFNWR